MNLALVGAPKLIACQHCQHAVAAEAKKCPSCGGAPAFRWHPVQIIIAFLAAMVGLAFYQMMWAEPYVLLFFIVALLGNYFYMHHRMMKQAIRD